MQDSAHQNYIYCKPQVSPSDTKKGECFDHSCGYQSQLTGLPHLLFEHTAQKAPLSTCFRLWPICLAMRNECPQWQDSGLKLSEIPNNFQGMKSVEGIMVSKILRSNPISGEASSRSRNLLTTSLPHSSRQGTPEAGRFLRLAPLSW